MELDGEQILDLRMHSDIDQLIEEIQAETRYTCDTTGVSAIAPEVIKALRETPRELFIPDGLRGQAYENHPLPVGYGQTISQPYIVAIMTQLLLPQAGHRILEVGAGTGYQAAVLARLVRLVVSLEIIPALAAATAQRLRELAVSNVEIHCADGNHGWPKQSPYDGIIVTACAAKVPAALLDQLKPGGRMIVPVGEPYGFQDLYLIRKGSDGAIDSRAVLPVAFVPLTHDSAPPSPGDLAGKSPRETRH